MIVALLVLIAFAVVYIAYLLDEMRGELQAISSDIPKVDLSSVNFSLDTIERIMLAEESKRDRAELETKLAEDEDEETWVTRKGPDNTRGLVQRPSILPRRLGGVRVRPTGGAD